jgi:hypothetical protein
MVRKKIQLSLLQKKNTIKPNFNKKAFLIDKLLLLLLFFLFIFFFLKQPTLLPIQVIDFVV